MCSVDTYLASHHVGFEVRRPQGIPKSWRELRGILRIYQNPLPPDEILPPGVNSAALYTEIWAPRDTDLNATGTCPANLVVRQRLAFPGDDAIQGEPVVDLGQGRIAYGKVAQPTTCGTGGPTKLFSYLTWVSDGIQFTLTGNSVGHDTMIRIAQSLHD
jgi:hypothetical protein